MQIQTLCETFVESSCSLHPLKMTRIVLSVLICSTCFACGQTHTSDKPDEGSKAVALKDTNLNKQLLFDISRIVILPIDTVNHRIFKNTIALQLTNPDLQTTDQLLTDCINAHNSKQDNTQRFSEYIDLKNYKRQYVPFTNSKGEKKVYINCFCISDYVNGFDYWKKILVEVDDGGSCFFQLTINLTTKQYEQLYTNGYG